MTLCVFCGKDSSPYKGVNQINNDGSISFFCSAKCRKNALNLKRDKRKLKWTEAYRVTKQKTDEREQRAVDKAAANK